MPNLSLPFSDTLPVVSGNTFLTIVFALLTVFFIVHSAIVAYHWMTYSNNRAQAFTALVVHVGVGIFILLVMAGILIF